MRRTNRVGMLTCVGALVALVCLSTVASAATVKLFSSGHRTGSGGEFAVLDEGIPSDPIDLDTYLAADVMQYNTHRTFMTFCLEKSEQINFNTSYGYSIDTYAVGGGGGASGGKDYLGAAAAKLFFAYWSGVLPDFDYDSDGNSSQRALDGQQLQIALWYLEEECDLAELNKTANAQAKDWVTWAYSKTWADIDGLLGDPGHVDDWTGRGRVRVLNLYLGTDEKQSQFIVMGDSTPGSEIPLPPAALMGIGLLGALGLVRRVRRRRR